MKKHLLSPLLALSSILLFAFAASPAPGSLENASMTVRFTTELEADGSGGLSYEIELSNEMMILLNTFSDMDSTAMCDSMFEYSYSDWEQSQEESEGALTCTADTTFADLTELESLIEDDFTGATFTRLEIENDHLYYDLAPHLQGSMFENAFGDEINIDLNVYWVVKMPGEVVDTNADTTSGRTLTWDLLTLSPSSHLLAESTLGGGGVLDMDPTLMILAAIGLMGCCCAVLLVIGGAAFIFLRRKNNPSA